MQDLDVDPHEAAQSALRPDLRGAVRRRDQFFLRQEAGVLRPAGVRAWLDAQLLLVHPSLGGGERELHGVNNSPDDSAPVYRIVLRDHQRGLSRKLLGAGIGALSFVFDHFRERDGLICSGLL